jgi:hypothetical protein
MDIGSDGITGGSFSILGQNKAGAPPKNTAGIEVISSSPSAGWASSSEGGINFPGTVGETINYPFHEYTIMARVPNTVEQNYVVVTGQVTMGAAEAARIMQESNVYVLIVKSESQPVEGMLKMHDLLQSNVV